MKKFASVPDYINKYGKDQIGINVVDLPHGLGKLIFDECQQYENN